jgi:hypothetical protein
MMQYNVGTYTISIKYLYNVGTYTISIKYLFKRGNRNTYCYRRRALNELAQHYSKPFIEISLGD